MNKFKKILLGALSVLTLGLVAVTGAKVNAAEISHAVDYSTGAEKEYTDGVIDVNANFFATSGSYKSLDASGSNGPITGTYIINNEDFSYTTKASRGIKMESSTTITFTTEHSATLKVLYGANTNNFMLQKGDDTAVAYGEKATKKTFVSTTISLDEAGTYKLKRNGGEVLILQVLVIESYESEAISSINSVSINSSFKVGDELTKNDLTVMVKYGDENEPVETSKFDFNVYNSNDEEVTGVFTSTGDGYYVVVTSKEDDKLSMRSSTFTVGEQTIFEYDCNAISLLSPFNADTDYHDYTTADNVITFNSFKKYSNTGTYTWDDGVTHNTNGLQGSTLTITLAKAARITFHATQTGGTAGKHDIRYMYFEDEDNNCIVSEMNFTISSSSVATKKAFSVNLPAGTYNSYSTDGGFNFYDIIIDYTNSSALEDTANASLILEHSTGTALNGSGTAARFVGVLNNVNVDDITSITLDLTLTLSDSTVKNVSRTITSVYTGLPGYDAKEGTLYFYFVIKGLEKDRYVGCSIKGTATVVMGTAKGFSSTTWSN